jgi:dihydrofolate reductase
MRKIILFNMVTLDGFFAGPDGEIDWHQTDDEFNRFAVEQTSAAGGLIFGRVTYDLMASYWPTPEALNDDPDVTQIMNSMPKFVVSRTLDKAEWNNTRLIRTNPVQEIAQLKQQQGRDLFIFGSANLAETLIQHDLIDEFRLMVAPVVLGSGRPLFHVTHQPLRLKLVRSRTFQNGNVLLTYQPNRDEPGNGD